MYNSYIKGEYVMELEKNEAIIEAILFSAGRVVKLSEIAATLEYTVDDVEKLIQDMKTKYEASNRGIEIIKVDDGYQMASKKEYYDYIYPVFDNRMKPSLSNAALETLSIIAYNPKITRAEIEAIRGVSSDATIYKLLEYELIENAGKLNAPGKPVTYKTTNEFLKKFGYSSLAELPELPKYKLDENEQIVLDEFEEPTEAPMPAEGAEGELKQEEN
jgi:segregation and condensation protein B